MSMRNYVTLEEVAEYADIEILDDDEARDQIGQAEELIDAYVGYQEKHFEQIRSGQATSGSSTQLFDISSDSKLNANNNYFSYCVIEIVAGVGSGQIKPIETSDKEAQSITLVSGYTFETPPDDTSIYKIYQLGKFPRSKDIVRLNSTSYKYIPTAIKRAVCAQVQYMIEKGAEFFVEATDFQEEGVGDWNYSVREHANRLIAPKARMLLKGIYNIKIKVVE